MPVTDDYAHPSLVEACKDADGNRHFVAVADEKASSFYIKLAI